MSKIISLKHHPKFADLTRKPIQVRLFPKLENNQFFGFKNLSLAKAFVTDYKEHGVRYEIWETLGGKSKLVQSGQTGLFNNSYAIGRALIEGSGIEKPVYRPAISDSDFRNAKKAQAKEARQANMTFHQRDHERTWIGHNSGRANVDQYDLRGLRKIWKERQQAFRAKFARTLYDGRNSANVAVVL